MALKDPSQFKLLKKLVGRRGRSPARKVRKYGITFDSMAECSRYELLVLEEKVGAIRRFRVHPRFEIVVNNEWICDYEADFSYERATRANPAVESDWIKVVEDVKPPKPRRRKRMPGVKHKRQWTGRTPDYELKKKLMLAVHGIVIREVSA